MKLFSHAVVAIDGSKFKAVNNRDKNFTAHKLKARMQQLEESVNRYLSELDRADRDPSALPEGRVPHLKEKLARVREQMQQLEEVGRQMEAAPDNQRAQIAAGSDDQELRRELATSLYALALTQPDGGATELKEAAALVAKLPAAMQQYRSVRLWRERIAQGTTSPARPRPARPWCPRRNERCLPAAPRFPASGGPA